MLRFLQEFPLSDKYNEDTLTSLATDIYHEFFAELIAYNNNNPHETLQLADFEEKHSNQQNPMIPTDDDVWIFGYGSLVWKADFPYIDRRRGYVCGFKRCFYQHSIDHRGVPDQPGRVVTLLPGEMNLDRVYGVAYRIAVAQKNDVLNHLDYREKNGYERCKLHFHEYPHITTPKPIDVIMYVATQTNDSYAGDVWQVPKIAEQIFTSAGPSGSNREYLFNLALAMTKWFPGAVDEHLTELVNCVRNLISNDEPVLLKRALCKEILVILNESLNRDIPLKCEMIVDRLERLLKQTAGPGWREAMLRKEMQSINS